MVASKENETKRVFTPAMEKMFSAIPGIEYAAEVPVVYAERLTESEFKNDWVQKNKACLIKGAVAHWPAVEKWRQKEYWLTQLNDFDVDVFFHSNFVTPELHNREKENITFHQAIERLYAHQDAVMSLPSKEIKEGSDFYPLKNEMHGFYFLPTPGLPRVYPTRRIFIYRGAATSWHYHDVDETLMCQLNGTKRVALLPSGIPKTRRVINFLNSESYLEGEKLDADIKLKPFMIDVASGDALYIPPYWYHAVVPVDDEIGQTLAYCWKSPWHKFGDVSNYFVRKLYRSALWPLNLYTFFLPFLAVYAGASFSIRKILGRV